MFKKKKQAGLLPGQDTHQLLEAMDKIANGNFEEADVTQFKNPVYAEKINAMCLILKGQPFKEGEMYWTSRNSGRFVDIFGKRSRGGSSTSFCYCVRPVLDLENLSL